MVVSSIYTDLVIAFIEAQRTLPLIYKRPKSKISRSSILIAITVSVKQSDFFVFSTPGGDDLSCICTSAQSLFQTCSGSFCSLSFR